MPINPPHPFSSLRRSLLSVIGVVAVLLCCSEARAQESVDGASPPVTMTLGQKMPLLPLLPESEARVEYPLTMRAEADDHGLYLVFDLEQVVLDELSRKGSPFYIDIHFDLSIHAKEDAKKYATRFRLVGRFDDGQMAVERTVSDDKGENLQTETKLNADARLSFLRSGTPRVSFFLNRKEIGNHPWQIGEEGQVLPFVVFAHFADFDRSNQLEEVSEAEGEADPEGKELTAEKGEPGEQVYPDWHTFVMARGLNAPHTNMIPTNSMNILHLHKFSLQDLTPSLRAIGQAVAKDDIVRRSNSVALMTILNAEVRGGVLMAREHKDADVREGAKWVMATEAFGGVDGGVTAPDNGSDTAGK